MSQFLELAPPGATREDLVRLSSGVVPPIYGRAGPGYAMSGVG